MITILHPGFLTTVQDGGRYGFQRFGVPVCGAMDRFALMQANLLAGNAPTDAALEITALGPQIRFETDAVFAVAGADFHYELSGEPIENGGAYLAHKGDVLVCGTAEGGFRGYIAFSGGMSIPEVMSSRSTCLSAHFGGFNGRALQKNDMISLRMPTLWLRGLGKRKIPCSYELAEPVRVVLGPQHDAFSDAGIDSFLHTEYHLSANCDRMGCRLEGAEISLKAGRTPNILSDGIAMGAIQVPNGKPIIMMADRQATGGYVKLGNVISADLPIIAQKRPGDAIHFECVSVEQAQKALRAKTRHLMLFAEDWENRFPW